MWGQDTSISYLSNDFETKIKETNPKLKHVSTIIIKALSHLSRVTSVNFLFLLILFKAMFSVTRRRSNIVFLQEHASIDIRTLGPYHWISHQTLRNIHTYIESTLLNFYTRDPNNLARIENDRSRYDPISYGRLNNI